MQQEEYQAILIYLNNKSYKKNYRGNGNYNGQNMRNYGNGDNNRQNWNNNGNRYYNRQNGNNGDFGGGGRY